MAVTSRAFLPVYLVQVTEPLELTHGPGGAMVVAELSRNRSRIVQ